MAIIKAEALSMPVKIAIVASQFNKSIIDKLFAGAMERLGELGCTHHDVLTVEVPGAGEIPLIAKRLAQTQKFDAIICLGVVIRGETTHYESVCDRVTLGCQQVMLSHDIPVIQAILTTENISQALDRLGGNHGHKGRDAVDAAFQMISVLRKI